MQQISCVYNSENIYLDLKKIFIFIEYEILYEKIEREITNYILDLILYDSIMEDTPKISKFIYGLSYLTKLMER